MKTHYCPAEKEVITFEGTCNWCDDREWVGLTDEEVKKEVEIEMKYYWDGDYIDSACACEQLNNFVRTIESKLKERNT